jgi:septal ring factor EnvC (AmiA/AmiB activator)
MNVSIRCPYCGRVARMVKREIDAICACSAVTIRLDNQDGVVVTVTPPAPEPRGTTAWAGAPVQDALTQLQNRADAQEQAITRLAKQRVQMQDQLDVLQDNSVSLERTTERIYESLHALKDRMDVQEQTTTRLAKQLVQMQGQIAVIDARLTVIEGTPMQAASRAVWY